MSRIITFFMSLFLSFTSIGATIAALTDHSLFLDSEGNIWSVGFNSDGQLGLRGNTSRKLPEKIKNLPHIIAIAVVSSQSLFLDADGDVWSVGDNKYGQLGLGDNNDVTLPQQITSLPPIMLPKSKVATKSARKVCL